ncbi:M48 family metallopeptidase [Hymenobacter arizonensis]|uniref:Peptidase family M48 n=1 Tax=Hymenobacter arizonensis TaxID=1227077 RepID=A0A1I5Z3S2_HYMAR|nr:M48 family metallopeptidase [Hymenobacter arizonensis]SFQ51101.1 Peptidase family M48 [Hymenobacter arizonensis]
MFKKLTLWAGVALLSACSTVPITGRRQLSLVSDSEINAMATTQYREIIAKGPLSTNSSQVAMVRNVGQRIRTAVDSYFRQQNAADQLAGYQWEFNLIQDDKQQNAWCMPGGKVAVYTGILPITQDENGLAVVMAHEVAHAVAKHGSERMSQGLVQQFGGQALSTALSTNAPGTQQLALQAFGVGSQLGLLRYGRNQETEADHLGLIFMAMAGYNPESAIPFWQRMEAKGGASPPEFLSTHPSSGTRIANIQRELPEARKYYKPR